MNKTNSSFDSSLMNWLSAGDLLFRLLLDKWQLSPTKVFLAAFVLFFLVAQLVYSWAIGFLFSNRGIQGSLDTWSLVSYWAVMLPSILAFYVWMPYGIADVFHRLKQNRVLTPELVEVGGILLATTVDDTAQMSTTDEILRFLKRAADKYLWLAISIACVILFDIIWYFSSLLSISSTWFGVNKLYLFLVFFPISGLAAPLIGTMIVRQAFVIIWLSKLFKVSPPNIHPLHPDNCGGMKPVGDYSLRCAYLISLIGLHITIIGLGPLAQGHPFRWTFELTTYYSLYLALAPVLFALPLISAHRAMITRKRQALLRISDELEENYKLMWSVIGKDDVQFHKCLDRIKDLETLYQMTQSSFPTWPVDFGILHKFIGVTIAPLLPSISIELIPRILILLRSS